jgi:hypothetical protein
MITLHDGTRHRVACAVQGMLHSMQWKLFANHLYSLDLSPCDFHVFGPLNKGLKGCRFVSGEDVKAVVVHSFAEGIC